jgi:hypothetical protein
MALTIILICTTLMCGLNALLIWDLYGRSARLAELHAEVHKLTSVIAHNIGRIQKALTPTE